MKILVLRIRDVIQTRRKIEGCLVNLFLQERNPGPTSEKSSPNKFSGPRRSIPLSRHPLCYDRSFSRLSDSHLPSGLRSLPHRKCSRPPTGDSVRRRRARARGYPRPRGGRVRRRRRRWNPRLLSFPVPGSFLHLSPICGVTPPDGGADVTGN